MLMNAFDAIRSVIDFYSYGWCVGMQAAFNRLDRKINETDCRTGAKSNDSNEFSGFLHICIKYNANICRSAWMVCHYHFNCNCNFRNRNRNRNDVALQLIQWWLQWCVTIGLCNFQSSIDAYTISLSPMCLLVHVFSLVCSTFSDNHSKRFRESNEFAINLNEFQS